MHFSVEREPNDSSKQLGSGSRGDGDTIAAISTAPGEGAISLVRVSGPKAVDVADSIFYGSGKPSEFAANTQHFGEIRDGEQLVDQVMISVHRAPASYTGEDLVEISCHGGVLVTAGVLERCLRAGARTAGPGEFTERAFLNGKMDLTQAEAVIDLIRAKTDLALRSATEQLEGRLGRQISAIRDGLVSLVANIEAGIDFPEEGIDPDDNKAIRARLESITQQIAGLLATADQGRILREGVRVVIYGATNAGKSSLLNQLLGHERVIVSETHGTTRDTIEEAVNMKGFPIRLIDTAGLREAADHVERKGIARTEKSLQQADLRLRVVDASLPRPQVFDTAGGHGAELLVLNKIDLSEHADWRDTDAVRISCVTGSGIPDLERKILARIGGNNLHPESSVAINTRHRECLRRALDSCNHAGETMDQHLALEYVAVDLKNALNSLGEIIGVIDVEQVLDSVFSQFCLGK